jgi:hypothetical protein
MMIHTFRCTTLIKPVTPARSVTPAGLIAVALAAASLLLSGGCEKQAAAPPAPVQPAHPDLSGFWRLAAREPADAKLMAQLPPDTVVLKDTGAPELPLHDFGGLKVKPASLEAAMKWRPEDSMTISEACNAPSIVYATQGPFPMEIFQGTEFIIIKMEYFDLVRIVFMDGRPHPDADFPHSKTGHSIGHWDGATLVVDTTHLEPATITNNGLQHSDKMHVIERFRLSDDGKTLLSTQEYEDPEVLDNRGARFIAWKLQPGEHVYAYDCDPSFALNYQHDAAGKTKQ